VYATYAHLADDIGRTFPIRLFRQGRREGAEPVLEAALAGVRRALAKDPALTTLMHQFDAAFERAIRPSKHGLGLKKLEEEHARWRHTKDWLQKTDRQGTEELVAWLDRDITERMTIARRYSRRGAAKKAKTPRTKTERSAKERAEQAREAYDAFVESWWSQPDERAFARLAAYFKEDDPLWDRIAEKVAAHRAGKDSGDVVHAIQGVIGEALALRNAWVVDSIVTAAKRAKKIASKIAKAERAKGIASKLGSDWDVVLTQMPVTASTRGGGVGEIYDAAVWIVKKTPPREAAPVFVLQVKSGTTRTAAKQIATDFRRELGDTVGGSVWLPAAKDGAKSEPRAYAIYNLRELLSRQDITDLADDVSTHRMLVSPRAPSTSSIIRELPEGTSVEVVDALMTKSELKAISGGIRDNLRTN
jgi:hypothetical protein